MKPAKQFIREAGHKIREAGHEIGEAGHKIKEAGHVPGPKCRCRECSLRKDLENKWIMKVGYLYGISGLNLRDEMKSQIRWNTRN